MTNRELKSDTWYFNIADELFARRGDSMDTVDMLMTRDGDLYELDDNWRELAIIPLPAAPTRVDEPLPPDAQAILNANLESLYEAVPPSASPEPETVYETCSECRTCFAARNPCPTCSPPTPSSPERERAQDTPLSAERIETLIQQYSGYSGVPDALCELLSVRRERDDAQGWLLTDRNVFDSFADSTDARVREGVKAHLKYLNSFIASWPAPKRGTTR